MSQLIHTRKDMGKNRDKPAATILPGPVLSLVATLKDVNQQMGKRQRTSRKAAKWEDEEEHVGNAPVLK